MLYDCACLFLFLSPSFSMSLFFSSSTDCQQEGSTYEPGPVQNKNVLVAYLHHLLLQQHLADDKLSVYWCINIWTFYLVYIYICLYIFFIPLTFSINTYIKV